MAADWNPLDSPQDYIRLAGLKSPGLAEIDGADAPRAWDVRVGMGLSGAWVVFKGNRLSKFKVRFKLYTSEDWTLWNAWRALVQKPPSGVRPKALAIQHPQLDALDIKAVVVENCDAGRQTDNGEWTFTVDFLEWRAPTPALAKPDASKPQPIDPIDETIERLSSQFQALAGPRPPPLPVAP
jgi:hypothetical protein